MLAIKGHSNGKFQCHLVGTCVVCLNVVSIMHKTVDGKGGLPHNIFSPFVVPMIGLCTG